jgi:uncharacterized protein YeaO (DUF488 family)
MCSARARQRATELQKSGWVQRMTFSDDSIYNAPQEGGGWRVLVMRRWPRGVRKNQVDEWLPDAAPSLDLLRAYQDGELDFKQLARRYTAELRTRADVLQHLRALERAHRNVVLLCWERSPRPCHRTVLARLLSRRRST